MSGAIRHWLDGFKLQDAPLTDSFTTPAPTTDYGDKILPHNAYEKQSFDDHDQVMESQTDGEKGEGGLSTSLQESGEPAIEGPGLRRKLNQFHIQMIAFGGSIGTGLYIGAGTVYASGGPGFLLLDFAIIGSMLYCVVMSLGELAVIFPVSGSFSTYAARFVSSSWGFALGWNYWMQWLTTLPLELVAAAIIIQYWDPEEKVSQGVWIIIGWLIVTVINIFGVKGYGNFEVFGSLLKIMMTLGFIVAGIVTTCGGGPNHTAVGVKYWRHGLAFLNGFKGFCSVFVSAAFSFSGTEMIGLSAAETKNPAKSVPKASRQVFFRIMLFYIGSLFVVTLNISPLDPGLTAGDGSNDPNSSPFVLVLKHAGIQVLPSIVNAVILVSSLSVGNTSTYATTRTLVALAQNGQAPRFFARCDREGRPMPAIIVSLAFGFIAFLCYSSSSGTVFNWLLALSGLSVIFSWGSICICYIRYRAAWKAAGRPKELIPWSSPVGLIGAWYGLFANVVILIFQAIIAIAPIGAENMTPSDRAVTFFQAYLAAPVTIVFLIWGELDRDAVFRQRWEIKRLGGVPVWYGPRRWWGMTWVDTRDIDIDTGRRDVPSLEQLEAERAERRQMSWGKKVLDYFF